MGAAAGLAAGAGLLIPTAAGAAPQIDGFGLGTPPSADTAEALTVTAGLLHAAVNVWAFRPTLGGAIVFGSAGVYATGDVLAAQINVPHGATLKELDAWGDGPTVVRLWRAPHQSLSWVNVGEVTVPDGTPGTIHVTIPDEVVNYGDNTYVVMVYGTSSTQTISTVRVGYQRARVVTPFVARALDTRQGGGAKLAAGSDTTVNLGVPTGAHAAVINLTVTETTGSSGYVGVYAGDVATWPGNSNVNWFGPGQNIASGVVAQVSPTGTIKLHVGENATHVIVDVQGYIS